MVKEKLKIVLKAAKLTNLSHFMRYSVHLQTRSQYYISTTLFWWVNLSRVVQIRRCCIIVFHTVSIVFLLTPPSVDRAPTLMCSTCVCPINFTHLVTPVPVRLSSMCKVFQRYFLAIYPVCFTTDFVIWPLRPFMDLLASSPLC